MTTVVWTITVDHIDGADVGVTGPRGCRLSADDIRRHPDREHFKMYDDDKNLYYEGFAVDLGRGFGGAEFEPLDHFGMPNAGCTSIYYRGRDGRYTQL